jgi:hypothetical protein
MSVHSGLFKGSEASFGIFYPKQYLVAILPDLQTAEAARQQILSGACRADEVVVLSGQAFLDLVQRLRTAGGLWSWFTTHLSRMIGTEEIQLEIEMEHARQGGAFLAAYCPDSCCESRLCQILRPLGSRSLNRYSRFGVERII